MPIWANSSLKDSWYLKPLGWSLYITPFNFKYKTNNFFLRICCLIAYYCNFMSRLFSSSRLLCMAENCCQDLATVLSTNVGGETFSQAPLFPPINGFSVFFFNKSMLPKYIIPEHCIKMWRRSTDYMQYFWVCNNEVLRASLCIIFWAKNMNLQPFQRDPSGLMELSERL